MGRRGSDTRVYDETSRQRSDKSGSSRSQRKRAQIGRHRDDIDIGMEEVVNRTDKVLKSVIVTKRQSSRNDFK